MLQLQALAAQHAGREKPLAVVATLNSPSIEDVLWHTTLSFHAELRAEAAAAAAREAAAWQGKHKGWLRRTQPPPEPAAAAAAVHAPVSLHLLRPDELMSGMLTQVRRLRWRCCDAAGTARLGLCLALLRAWQPLPLPCALHELSVGARLPVCVPAAAVAALCCAVADDVLATARVGLHRAVHAAGRPRDVRATPGCHRRCVATRSHASCLRIVHARALRAAAPHNRARCAEQYLLPCVRQHLQRAALNARALSGTCGSRRARTGCRSTRRCCGRR